MNPGLEDSGPRAVASLFLRPQNETPGGGTRLLSGTLAAAQQLHGSLPTGPPPRRCWEIHHRGGRNSAQRLLGPGLLVGRCGWLIKSRPRTTAASAAGTLSTMAALGQVGGVRTVGHPGTQGPGVALTGSRWQLPAYCS